MSEVVGIITAITGILFTVWGGFYFGFARHIDVERIREKSIEKIKSDNEESNLKQIIDVIYEVDFRLLYKKEKNSALFWSFFILVSSNLLLIVSLVIIKMKVFDGVIGESILVIQIIIVFSFLFSFISTVGLLYFAINYYVKFDEHHRSLDHDP